MIQLTCPYYHYVIFAPEENEMETTPRDRLRLAILQYHKDTKVPLPPAIYSALKYLDHPTRRNEHR